MEESKATLYKEKNEEVYKVQLLKDKSNQGLHEQQICDQTDKVPTSECIEKELGNIKNKVKQATKEALGTRKKFRWKI